MYRKWNQFELQLTDVYLQNNFLGRIDQVSTCMSTRKQLEIWNKNEQKIFDICGPCLSLGVSSKLQITNDSGSTMVGEISKTFHHTLRLLSTIRGEIKVKFPYLGPDVNAGETKALLIASALLLDYVYFERLTKWSRRLRFVLISSLLIFIFITLFISLFWNKQLFTTYQ